VAPSVQRLRVWLTATTRVPCSNAAKTRNPLKFAGVPQTHQQISAVSGPKFTLFLLRRRVEKILPFNKFFPIADTCLICEDIAGKVVRWCPAGDYLAIFLLYVFSASPVQHISHVMHSKFALRPHHVWKYGRHPVCDGEIRRGKKEEERMYKPQDGNIMSASATPGGHMNVGRCST